MKDIQFDILLRVIVDSIPAEESITESDLRNQVESVSNLASLFLRDPSIGLLSDEIKTELFQKAKEKVYINWEPAIGIYDKRTRLIPWFEESIPESNRYFWNRYKEFLLKKKNWSPKQVKELDDISSLVINQAGNPKSETEWNRYGLVIGEVQSGKTANYTAFCNKAADAGYDVIIILAGISESLRFQTQTRLDMEFAGRETGSTVGNSGKFFPTGVGLFANQQRSPANCTSANSDFSINLLEGQQFSLNGWKETTFFVLKKHVKVLENVVTWLTKNNEVGSTGKIEKTLLLIDDESDNASQNTMAQECNPTKTNGWVRKILNQFTKSSYMAITATPFANIFVDPDVDDKDFGAGLFPKDYLFKLAKSSNYLGVNEIFGDDSKLENILVEINLNQIEGTKDNPGILPLSHKKDSKLESLPDDLYDALRYFLLSNAILDRLEKEKHQRLLHRSMLVNISRFIIKHDEITVLINDWLLQARADINNYATLAERYSSNQDSGELYEIHRIWQKFFNDPESCWIDLALNYLSEAIKSIEAVPVNQNKQAKEALDFELATKKNEGHRFIYIGGFALARGLTLEGLIVSYFYRRTCCYDTLLQMGRWFGYRPNYSDLVKIWMSKDLMDSYHDIACEVLPDLYNQIDTMNETNLSPIDFGLMIRNNVSSLEITARNKMRTARDYMHPCEIRGHLIETPRLINKKGIIRQNNTAVLNFLSTVLCYSMNSNTDYGTKGLFWKGVSGHDIASLVKQFRVHPWHLSFQSETLAEYIIDNEITNWDLYIAGNNEPSFLGDGIPIQPIYIKGINQEINPFPRKMDLNKQNANMLRVSGSKLKVGSGAMARIGLSEDEYKNVKMKNDYKSLSDSMLLNVEGRRPLLIIYPLKMLFENQIDGEETKDFEYVFAIGLGFPGDKNQSIKRQYKINLVKARELFEEEEYDE
ncbi:Z1 domain-containing protein [Sphaerochaeta globosa]|uniref:Endonuclease, Z1 domain-containing protein n=1 Tax=Sphaerochaeta globosa (strain ATCC BAA-1886 / DSM 22777 / Buddy) TaxID=158189 RepID=F0RW27_SPHGB|nr:Z1 domain-containing protein [Sphaerochaeta globosa]ADY13313.1 endonuclease, Z1 domain-containing protein [Sphaerochaeta globosa str. Buddy]